MRWADGLPGLGRNGPQLPLNRRENARGRLRPCTDGAFPCERGTDGGAGDEGTRELALPHKYGHYPNYADAEGLLPRRMRMKPTGNARTVPTGAVCG